MGNVDIEFLEDLIRKMKERTVESSYLNNYFAGFNSGIYAAIEVVADIARPLMDDKYSDKNDIAKK